MKVYTKIVFNWDGEVVEEESFEYEGEILECKGSSGGGGGGTGVVDYPAHMKTIHQDWLNQTGADTIVSSMTDVMNSAIGSSPWAATNAYDPDADITSLIAAPNVLQTLVDLLSDGTTLDALISSVLDQSRIDDQVTEYAADFDARLTSEVLPRFEAGMRDINAVTSSAFAIGRATIEENQDRQVAKFSADLHSKAWSDDAIRVIGLKLEYQKFVSTMISEAYRIKIVAKKEQSDTDDEIDKSDALWDLEVFQYGANLLASIGGGTAINNPNKPSTAQSMIGGAMSGAAAGAMVGGPKGAIIGGVLGAASGLL